MALHGRQAMIFALLLGLAGLAAAARLPEQQQVVVADHPHAGPQTAEAAAAEPPSSSASSRSLLTYYFDATQPRVQLSARGSSRPERTAITVTLPRPQSVSRFMPVVSPRPTGMTHEVANTWQALKNLAVMFSHVDALNTAAGPPAARLFPRTALAVRAASDNAPGKLDVNAIITYAQAQGQHSSWAETTPGSVLLLPFGQSTGAVADVMGAAYDAQADSITLELDIVHQPHTISEFDPHGKQTVEVDQAHYHFDTAPRVKVDAQGLIKSLQSSGAAVEGVHIFLKGIGPPPPPPPLDDFPTSCLTASVSVDPFQVQIDARANVSVTLSDSLCRRATNGTSAHVSSLEGTPVALAIIGPGYFSSEPVNRQSTKLAPGLKDKLMATAAATVGRFKGKNKDNVGALDTSIRYSVLTVDDQGYASTLVEVSGVGPVTVLVAAYEDGVPARLDYTVINPTPSCLYTSMPEPFELLQANVGGQVTLNMQLVDACLDNGLSDQVNATLTLALLGPGDFNYPLSLSASPQPALNGMTAASARMARDRLKDRLQGKHTDGAAKDWGQELITLQADASGLAAVNITVTGAGAIHVVVVSYGADIIPFQTDYAVINENSIPKTCYGANMVATPTQAVLGEIVRLDITLTYACEQFKVRHASTPQRGNSSASFDHISFRLAVIGQAQFIEQIDPDGGGPVKKNNKKSARPSSGRSARVASLEDNPISVNDEGKASVLYEVTGPGQITWVITDYADGILGDLDIASINALPAGCQHGEHNYGGGPEHQPNGGPPGYFGYGGPDYNNYGDPRYGFGSHKKHDYAGPKYGAHKRHDYNYRVHPYDEAPFGEEPAWRRRA